MAIIRNFHSYQGTPITTTPLNNYWWEKDKRLNKVMNAKMTHNWVLSRSTACSWFNLIIMRTSNLMFIWNHYLCFFRSVLIFIYRVRSGLYLVPSVDHINHVFLLCPLGENSGAHEEQNLLVAPAVVFVAQSVDNRIHTASGKSKKCHSVVFFRVRPHFSCKHQKGSYLIRCEADRGNKTNKTNHPCHFPAKFSLTRLWRHCWCHNHSHHVDIERNHGEAREEGHHGNLKDSQ